MTEIETFLHEQNLHTTEQKQILHATVTTEEILEIIQIWHADQAPDHEVQILQALCSWTCFMYMDFLKSDALPPTFAQVLITPKDKEPSNYLTIPFQGIYKSCQSASSWDLCCCFVLCNAYSVLKSFVNDSLYNLLFLPCLLDLVLSFIYSCGQKFTYTHNGYEHINSGL